MFTNFPKAKRTFGGILADEMGLGKTVMTIGLLHENKTWPVLDEAEERSNIFIANLLNLIEKSLEI